jgi:hypothetical protein
MPVPSPTSRRRIYARAGGNPGDYGETLEPGVNQADPELGIHPGERALWLNVVAMGVEDFKRSVMHNNGIHKMYYKDAQRMIKEGGDPEYWVSTDSEDLELVCYMAGIDPGALRRRMEDWRDEQLEQYGGSNQ